MGLRDAVVARLGRVGAAGGRERGAMPLVCDLCVVPCSGKYARNRAANKKPSGQTQRAIKQMAAKKAARHEKLKKARAVSMPNLSLQHANVLLMSMPVTCNDSQSAVVENLCVFREVEGRKTCLGGEVLKMTLYSPKLL